MREIVFLKQIDGIMIEIERKFLVTSLDFMNASFAKNEIAQGYLNSNPERTVRIRIKGEKGYITIKGSGNESGTSRMEWKKKSLLMMPNHY